MYYNFLDDCDWLIELSDNKLPNNKLSDNNLVSELVENTVEFFKPITLTARGCTGNTDRCAVQVTIYKSCIIAVFLHVVHGKYRTSRLVLGLRMGRNGEMERSISIGPVQPRKVVHLEGWADFFGWSEPIHSVLDRNFWKFWLNVSRSW